MTDHVKAIHETMIKNFMSNYVKYKIVTNKRRRKKIFDVEDQVMIYLCKERLPTYSHN